MVFFLDNTSVFLSNTVMFYITFFTICAILFLLNLRYTFNYSYLSTLWLLDLFFFIAISYLLLNTAFLIILFF
jgi:hypothetical protein